MKRLVFALGLVLGLAYLVPPAADAGWGSCNCAPVGAPQLVAPAAEGFTGWDSDEDDPHIMGYYRNGVQVAGYNARTHILRSYDRATDTWGPPERPPWPRMTCTRNEDTGSSGKKANRRTGHEECPEGCGCDQCGEGCNCGTGNPCKHDSCTCLVGAVTRPATAMDLPAEIREWFRNPDGSCVQCSIGMCGIDQNVPAAATLLWDTDYGPKERGGAEPSRVKNYCDRRGIPAYNVTGSNTWDWMRWACLTGRGAAIGAGGAHFQTLYGYDPASKHWYVCNNNSPQKIDDYDDDHFRRLHLASGQWCVILKAPPRPERPEYVRWWASVFPSTPAASGFGQGQGRGPEVERDEVIRRGDAVEVVGEGARADELEAWTQAMATPRDDSDKWFISIITMQGCAPCQRLKADWATNADLRAFAKPETPTDSWAHFSVYDKDDKSQQFRFANIKIGGYPTVIIQPPRNGSYGEPKTVVFQHTGYDGNPGKFAKQMSEAMRRYVATLPRREKGVAAVRPPWQPPPKPAPNPAPGPGPAPAPDPNIPGPVIPPEPAPGPTPATPGQSGPVIVLALLALAVLGWIYHGKSN